MAGRKNKGLGKGLSALFEEVEVSVPVSEESNLPLDDTEKGIMYIDVNDIKPNTKQPRKNFSEESLNELSNSIKTYGVMEPIIVRNAGHGYEIVMGERRWRATRKLGRSVIPALIKEINDTEMAILALIENMQREDLNPLEIAVSLKELINDQELTQSEVSSMVGKSRAYVGNILRLLNLPEEVRIYIEKGQLSGGHGKAIAMIDNREDQIKIADKAVKKGMSVHDIERLAGKISPKKSRKKNSKDTPNHEIKQIEDELTSLVGAKIHINHSGNKGKIEMHYYSQSELNNLIDILRKIK